MVYPYVSSYIIPWFTVFHKNHNRNPNCRISQPSTGIYKFSSQQLARSMGSWKKSSLLISACHCSLRWWLLSRMGVESTEWGLNQGIGSKQQEIGCLTNISYVCVCIYIYIRIYIYITFCGFTDNSKLLDANVPRRTWQCWKVRDWIIMKQIIHVKYTVYQSYIPNILTITCI